MRNSPTRNGFRIMLADLAREDIRERLAAIWPDPLSLDPSRHAAKVTREVAARLAVLDAPGDGGPQPRARGARS